MSLQAVTFEHTIISYDTARKIKEKQDAYCVKALQGQWTDLGEFPEDLQWEALVDVLRGRVKVRSGGLRARKSLAYVRYTRFTIIVTKLLTWTALFAYVFHITVLFNPS